MGAHGGDGAHQLVDRGLVVGGGRQIGDDLILLEPAAENRVEQAFGVEKAERHFGRRDQAGGDADKSQAKSIANNDSEDSRRFRS